MADISHWTRQLADRRGKEVVFLSHCLLNENTRYLGGACERGASPPIIRTCLERGYGVVQMPCPEEHAWGGVLKRHLLRFYGSQGTLQGRMRFLLLPALLWYTRRIYRHLARGVAGRIRDYTDSGFKVVGIVAVDGSPSCGSAHTINIHRSLDLVSRLGATATADELNSIVLSSIAPGRGLFIDELQTELRRQRLSVAFVGFDLASELKGRPNAPRIGDA